MILEDIWMNITVVHAFRTECWTVIETWLLQLNIISTIHVKIPFFLIPTVIHFRTTNLAIIIHFSRTDISKQSI